MTVRELTNVLERCMVQGKLTGEEVVFDSAMFQIDSIEIHGEDLGENFVRISNVNYDSLQFDEEDLIEV